MSCRPRPVTATVTKPKWMEPKVLAGRSRTLSLDSSGSTSSLVSVLDHDSYDSYESENEPEEVYEKVTLTYEHNDEHNEDKNNIADDYSILSPSVDNRSEDVSKVENLMHSLTTEDNDGLSSWESWLIRKTKLQRLKQKEMIQKKKKEKQEKEEEANIKALNNIKAEEKRKIWLEKKNYEEKLRKIMEKKRKRSELDMKKDEKKRIEDKSECKFREWLENKNSLAKQEKINEKIKKKEEEKSRKEKEEKAQEKFENWCKLAQKRPKSVPNSFGYTSGKLTGYHDRSAYPVPTFYNPVPWQPNQVNKVRYDANQRRMRSKSKYQWNPDKYH